MARGFLSGVLLGGVVSVGVAGVASVIAPLPMPPEVGDLAPGVTEAPAAVQQSATVTEPPRSDTDDAPANTVPAQQAMAPTPDDMTLGADVTTPAGQPETGAAEGLDAPITPEATQAMPEAEEPVLPNPQALAPMEPQPADELSISTEPAQPPAPEVAEVEGAFDSPVVPDAPAVDSDATAVESDAPAPENDDAPQEAATPQSPVTAQTDAAPEAEETPPEDAPAVATPEPEPAPAPKPLAREAEGERPAIGTPAVTLTDRDSGVTVNRLTESESETETAEISGAEPAPETEGDPRPLVKNSVEFEGVTDKPMMAVVLIDDGASVTAGADGLAALRSFPYPLSFAVDSSLPDAADRVATYRAAGFEVLAMVDLPEGAQPSDAETTFGVTLDKVGDVVGILEGTGAGFQGSRDLADQVTAILAQSGHGLVTQDKGLNTMPKLARKAGVPAEPIFRDFDSKDQSATVIRRFLDQAAFKAGQEGAVIMLGRLRPDTVSALLLWGLQDRAGQVALVPISAVLLRGE